MPCPVYWRTTAHPAARVIGSLTEMSFSNHTWVERRVETHITLPRSRKSAPGLQSLMASSRLCRVVFMSFLDSSSTLPTG